MRDDRCRATAHRLGRCALDRRRSRCGAPPPRARPRGSGGRAAARAAPAQGVCPAVARGLPARRRVARWRAVAAGRAEPGGHGVRRAPGIGRGAKPGLAADHRRRSGTLGAAPRRPASRPLPAGRRSGSPDRGRGPGRGRRRAPARDRRCARDRGGTPAGSMEAARAARIARGSRSGYPGALRTPEDRSTDWPGRSWPAGSTTSTASPGGGCASPDWPTSPSSPACMSGRSRSGSPCLERRLPAGGIRCAAEPPCSSRQSC